MSATCRIVEAGVVLISRRASTRSAPEIGSTDNPLLIGWGPGGSNDAWAWIAALHLGESAAFRNLPKRLLLDWYAIFHPQKVADRRIVDNEHRTRPFLNRFASFRPQRQSGKPKNRSIANILDEPFRRQASAQTKLSDLSKNEAPD
jgi:hypothetical protein